MASIKTILIVEDEADLAGLVRFNLQREGYACVTASDGTTALAEARRRPPDLIILDRMLPGMSGDDVASKIRGGPRTAGIPIIMLTAKAEETDELVGFALGADDYITKPFSMQKLVARVAAVLRRGDRAEQCDTTVIVGPFTLDSARHAVAVYEHPVALTTTEFKLLAALMSADGRVLDRSRLIDAAMGVDAVVTDRTIDVHITSLRRKLAKIPPPHESKDASLWIQTVRGVGYALRAPE